MWAADIFLAVKIYLNMKDDLQLAIIAQLRIVLVNLLCLGSENMTIKVENNYIRMMFESFESLNLLGIFIGVNHALVVRDLL